MKTILVILVASVFVLSGICFSSDLDEAQRKVNKAKAEKKLEDKKDEISSEEADKSDVEQRVDEAQRKVNKARAEKKLEDKKDEIKK